MSPIEVAPQSTLEKVHAHHWSIESPNGSTSKGVCKNCGARKEFSNYIEDPGWERGPSPVTFDVEKKMRSEKERRNKFRVKKTAEEKVAALSKGDIEVLQLVANGFEAQEIKDRLGMTKEEYATARSNCSNAGESIRDAIRIGMRKGRISLIEEPNLTVHLEEPDVQLLDLLVKAISVDVIAYKLNKTTDNVTVLGGAVLKKIGAVNRFHAVSIMEARKMSSAVLA